MLSNPDPSKLAQEVLRFKFNQPLFRLKECLIKTSYQDILLGDKLNFKQHISIAILKLNKVISALKSLDIIYEENY